MTDHKDPFFEMISKAASAEVNSMCANAGQITLGELAARIESVPADTLVVFDGGGSPGHLSSYRGYYEFIAIEPNGEPRTAGDFLQEIRDAIGRVFTGYKGGDYTMTKMTPVWVSAYGHASGLGLIGAAMVNGQLVLQTKQIED